jgi:hydrogenase maturation protease
MRERKLPSNVELLDGGTASLDLLDSLSNRERVIIIDAVRGGGEPGTLYRFSPSDIAAEREHLSSLHQIGLLETMAMAEYLGCAPCHVTIYGIEPKKVDWGLELSPEVAAVVPRVIELVLSEL